MLREQRLEKILEMLEENNVIKISNITKKLSVTEMTVRRDLKVLEEKSLLVRIHGGAKRKNETSIRELSHNEKKIMNVEQKKYIASIAASLIEENDTIFIGPGTTNEFIYDFIDISYGKVVTNSIAVFLKFAEDSRFELILAGGKLRTRTGTFVGSFTNDILKKIRVKKAFIGTNGIYENNITTFNEEEGVSQRLILDNAVEKYVLTDSTKFNKEDFYSFYDLNSVTAIITDDQISTSIKKQYEKITDIINKK